MGISDDIFVEIADNDGWLMIVRDYTTQSIGF
jgi:hypothetical protein